jgi:2-methylcitrate synthase
MTKKLEEQALRGQVAGETSLSTVGQIEGLLIEVIKLNFLQKKQHLKKLLIFYFMTNSLIKSELDEYKQLLKSLRDLPVP